MSQCTLTKTKQGCCLLAMIHSALVTPRIPKYTWPKPEGVVQAGTFHTEHVKTITITYALILFFNISSDIRCMKISRKKLLAKNLGGGGGGGMPSPRNYTPVLRSA